MLPLLLRAEIPKVYCFGDSHISRMANCSLIQGHSVECHSHKQGTKQITGQYSLLRTSAPQEVLVAYRSALVRTGQHWSVYTREASEIFKLAGC